MEPLSKKCFGTSHGVHCREDVLFWEVSKCMNHYFWDIMKCPDERLSLSQRDQRFHCISHLPSGMVCHVPLDLMRAKKRLV